MKKKLIGLITSFYRGIPYHMKNSGYEKLVDFIYHDKLYFSKKSKWAYRMLAPLAHTHIIPLSYAFMKEEANALRQCDIIHHLYGEDTFFLSLLFNAKKKIIVTFHTPVNRFKEVMPFYVNNLIKNIDIIVLAPSQQYYFKKMGCKKVHLIPHGIDTDYFKPASTKKKYILSVGSHLRDNETIIHAMDIIAQGHKDIKLIVVSNKFKSSRPNIIVKKNISDEELLKLYHESVAQIISLKDATANNALLEGYACALPCIISNIDDIKFYTNDKGCLYFDTGDHKSLASQMLKIINNPKLVETLSIEARKQALDLSWKNAAKKIQEIYDE